MDKTTILFLASNPRDSSRLRLDHEIRDIRQQLRLSKQRDNFLITSREAVRASDITQAILDTDPNIVHFSGHGTDEGQLCIENSYGKTQLLPPSALANLFKVVHKVDCVVLNACHSKNQAQAIAQHISFVIGMNQAIGDKAAIAFSVGFYQALGAGRSIEEAYRLGCVQIELFGISEYLTPTLIKKTTNPSFLYGNDIDSPNLIFQKQQDNSRVELPISQLRKHLAVIGWTGSGRSCTLHWLSSTLLKQHNISFLWIGHWYELSKGIADKISHRKIEDNTHNDSNDRTDITSELSSVVDSLTLEYLSNHPTIIEIDSNDYHKEREVFKFVFENILKKLSRNSRSSKLKLVIIVDELDQIYKNDSSSFDLSDHLYALRQCGIGIIFTSSSFDCECVSDHVRNFIVLPMSAWAYQRGATKFKELANTQSSMLYRRERGEAIFSARGIIEPVLVCIPKLQRSF